MLCLRIVVDRSQVNIMKGFFNINKEVEMKEKITKLFRVTALASVTGLTLIGMGCASANVDVLSKPVTNLVQPDFILVNDLAVTADEVTMDKGFAAQAIRETGDQTQSQMEIQVGHAVAKALTDGLVENLRLAGIRAGAARDGHKPTDKTLVVYGKFIRINQGDQTLRVWVGFGFGNGEMQALMECSQGGRFINKAMITTSGSLKPGLAVPVAGGAAAGTVLVSSAVAGSAAGLSETFLSTVQADANRASKEVAKKIVQGYINRGWLAPEALDKLNTFF